MAAFPGPLRVTASLPFVGRARELAVLRALLPHEDNAGGRVALIGGEPGSGKSRLTRELAREAAAAGIRVLHGGCEADVRTPYRPFAEALTALVRSVDAGVLRAALGATGGELRRLVPDLPAGLPAPLAADPDTVRHRLHTAVSDLLAGITVHDPALVVLEDAHWADAPTLLLLRHLARAAGDARVLIAVTFRDSEGGMSRELADALVDLRRSDAVVRLRLEGLTSEDIAELVGRAAGGTLAPDAAGAIRELTAGNALLVTELLRSLLEGGALSIADGALRISRPVGELATPESVRELAGQRLSRLAPGTTELLELAAVAGPVLELGLLRRTSELAEGELRAAIEEALRSGMLDEVPDRPLTYRFAHELVRRALYDRLTGLRRAELHLRVGTALEEAPDGRPAELAHHFAAAGALGDLGRAVEYNLRAAEAALSALAFDEAAACVRTALALGIADPAERARAHRLLGTAHQRAGRWIDAREAFAAAAALGRELGDPAQLADAAIGFEEACFRPPMPDQGAVELLQEAAAALGDADSPLGVRVLGGLARALARRGDADRAAAVQADAIALARRLDDRPGLARVLMHAYWSRGRQPLGEVLDMLTEARELSAALGDVEVQVEAMAWRVAALITLGDLRGARREQAAVLALAERLRQPFMLHVAEHYSAALALCEGDLAAAEAAAERSRDYSRLLTGQDASGIYGVQMFSIRREQGRLAELAPVLRLLAAPDRAGGAWRPGLAALLAELGMRDEARREVARIRAHGLDPFRGTLWMATLTYLADAAAALGDADLAALVLPELEPHAGAVVTIGHGVACYGAVERHLGMLAATLRDWDAAAARFETALERDRRMGAPTWLAHTALEYGRTLLARGRAEDRRRAGELLAEAAALGQRIGMPALLARVRELEEPAAPDGLSPRELEILRLVARGHSNREIGERLFISEHTAANHIRSILRKTGCANRTEAAAYAHRRGLAGAAALE